jgi:2-oxoisovalerate dehydrogenase E1 component beta subunit
VCGLRTVMPSNPYDAKGLLISAIECNDPVIFLEPKRIYNGPFDGHHDRPVVPWSSHRLSEVPEGHYTVPLESASVVRPGAELAALVQEHCFYHLEAPIERVTGWDTPYPHAQEWAYFPGPQRVGEAFKRAVEK